MKKILALAVLSMGIYAQVSASFNPVVQIMGYDDVAGLQPSMMGRGSASVISKDGLILTNNHVVDDGKGGLIDGFAICVTQDINKRPDCNYTASLIARDPKKDVAILRIDPKDIFGNSVDYTLFTTIEIDFAYIPMPKDVTLAIGYPWVGVNTITQTQGIVAGTQQYNNALYIKTDAMIAGGNSGGPLTFNGKLIGVNTFGVGNEGGLGYALLASEVQPFLEKNKNTAITPVNPKLNFPQYLRQLSSINTTKKLSDGLVSLNLPKAYFITHYVPGLHIIGSVSDPDDTSVQQFAIQRVSTPTFKDKKEQEYFMRNILALYSPENKLVEKMIGGLKFYEPVYIGDPSEGNSNGYKRYFSLVNEKELIIITAYSNLWDPAKHDEIKKELDGFLAGIMFGDLNTLPSIRFDLNTPKISLPVTKRSFVDIFGQIYYSNWGGGVSEYYGRNSSITYFLDSIYETLRVVVAPFTLYDGKGKDIATLFETASQQRGAASAKKGIIIYKGYEGYMLCDENNQQGSDMQGNYFPLTVCTVRLFVGTDTSHILDITLSVKRTNYEKQQKTLISLLDQATASMGAKGNGETLLPKEIFNKTKLKFTDIKNQSKGIQSVLVKFVERGLVKNKEKFNGDQPMTWGNFLPWYILVNYNKNLADQIPGREGVTFADVVKTLNVDPDAYIPSYYFQHFDLLMRAGVAGVTIADISELGLSEFTRLADTTYIQQRQTIKNREYTYFGERKMSLGEALNGYDMRNNTTTYIYNPVTKTLTGSQNLSSTPIVLDKPYPLEYTKQVQQRQECVEKGTITKVLACKEIMKGWMTSNYAIMTKGELFNYLMQNMDVALFDPYWAKKKNPQIIEESTMPPVDASSAQKMKKKVK